MTLHQRGRWLRILQVATAAAVVSGVTVGASVSAFAAPSTTPTLTAPTDASVVAGDVALTATSTQPSVQFVVDGSNLGSPVAVAAGSATTTWSTFGLVNDGAHTIAAADCDGTGCGTPSATISVTVHNSAPTLTSPAAGETVGAATTLTATALGGGVKFFVDGVAAGFDGSAPFADAVSNLTEGTHTAAVRACDAAGTTCTGPTSSNTSFTVQVLHPAITSLSPTGISPNGDGRSDATTVTYSLPESEAVSYSVVVQSSGVVVRGPVSEGVPGAGSHSFVWNGFNNSGGRVADGLYNIELHTYRHLTGSEIARGFAVRGVRVDDTAPSLASLTGAGATFYPYPDTYGDTWTPHITVGESATVNLDIYNSHKALLRRLSVYHSGAGTVALTWNGRTTSGTIVSAGTYSFRFWAQDLAGNQHFTAYYAIHVSGLRLIAKVATIQRNGNSAATIWTTDTSCTGYSFAASHFATGVFLENTCTGSQVIFADYLVALPKATRYTSIGISSYGNTTSAPESIAGAWYSYTTASWALGSLVGLTKNSVNASSALGTVSASGRVTSSSYTHVGVVVPSVVPPEDYDIGTVTITLHYQVLG